MTQRTKSRAKRSNPDRRPVLDRFMLGPEDRSDQRTNIFTPMLSKVMVPVIVTNGKLDRGESLSKEDKRAVMDAIDKLVEPNAEDKEILMGVACDRRYPKRIREAAASIAPLSPFDKLMAGADRVRKYNE